MTTVFNSSEEYKYAVVEFIEENDCKNNGPSPSVAGSTTSQYIWRHSAASQPWADKHCSANPTKVDDIESFILQRLCYTYQKKILDFFYSNYAVFNRVSGASTTKAVNKVDDIKSFFL
ncbi:hypothetical protein HPB47_015992 [Ixodes persulcatus]|uniref:Uncharacterized protein n=1 Tax=Ixodes persulcatus TaxID=34615 RepID=A0AC60QRZ6_IXOPE|nr:hypothetical protein HPB47_015992 [Ixodes persulcatus]